MKKFLSIVFILSMIFSFSACSKKNPPVNTPPQEIVSLVDESTPTDNKNQSTEDPKPVEEVNPNLKTYSNTYISFEYDERYMKVLAEEDKDDYVLSCVSVKEEEGEKTVPRIEIISMPTMEGIYEEALIEASEALKQQYEAFIYTQLSVYYNIELDENGQIIDPLIVNFGDTQIQTRKGLSHLFTSGTIEPTRDSQKLKFEAEVIGTTKGVLVISLYQPNIDDASKTIMDNLVSSITLKSA